MGTSVKHMSHSDVIIHDTDMDGSPIYKKKHDKQGIDIERVARSDPAKKTALDRDKRQSR